MRRYRSTGRGGYKNSINRVLVARWLAPLARLSARALSVQRAQQARYRLVVKMSAQRSPTLQPHRYFIAVGQVVASEPDEAAVLGATE